MNYQETDDYGYDAPAGNNSTANGLKIAIAILFIVLAAVTFLYWQSARKDAAEIEIMNAELDTLRAKGSQLSSEMAVLEFDNDTLNANLASQRHVVDSLMDRMKRERNVSYSKIKRYERELGTLRTTMQSFVRTIDSLNRLNQKLTGDNTTLLKKVKTLETTVASTIETATDLSHKIKKGAVIRARDITLRAVNRKDKEVSRAKTADRLITTLVLAANELAEPGERTVYVRIVSPDGFDLSENQNLLFEYEGSRVPYTAARKVDYQSEDLPVSVYYNGTGLIAGQYTVHVYMDGHLIGSNVIILK